MIFRETSKGSVLKDQQHVAGAVRRHHVEHRGDSSPLPAEGNELLMMMMMMMMIHNSSNSNGHTQKHAQRVQYYQ
jgi:hypothetical protein